MYIIILFVVKIMSGPLSDHCFRSVPGRQLVFIYDKDGTMGGPEGNSYI